MSFHPTLNAIKYILLYPPARADQLGLLKSRRHKKQLGQLLKGTRQAMTRTTASTGVLHDGPRRRPGYPNLTMDRQTDAILKCSRIVCRTDRVSEHRRAFSFFLAFAQITIFFRSTVARGSANFSILSHALKSAPSHTVLIAHVTDAQYSPLTLPRPLPEIHHHHHTSHYIDHSPCICMPCSHSIPPWSYRRPIQD